VIAQNEAKIGKFLEGPVPSMANIHNQVGTLILALHERKDDDETNLQPVPWSASGSRTWMVNSIVERVAVGPRLGGLG
jgi:hypothetical protein